jgi:hypothetical protein
MATNKFNELKTLIESIESDYAKFIEKGNKTAGVRVRKVMQDIKSLAQEIRVEISEKRKDTVQ